MKLILEFLEIYINQIIYIRGIYPHQIFRKRKAYCLPVFYNIYPPLNDYLQKSLICTQHLLETQELRRVEIQIYNDDGNQESFCIDIFEDLIIDEIELKILQEVFRQCLCELDIKCKILNELKRSSKFRILLHTKNRAYQNLCNDSNYQDFLWRKVTNDESRLRKVISPIKTCDFMSLHIEHFV